MTTRRIILAILLVLAAGLYGCAAPQPYSGTGYGQQSYIPPGYANPYTPYMGMHDGRCYYKGFVQPTNDMCLNGTIQTPVQGFAGNANGVVPQGMTPERAKDRITALDQRYAQLCSGENRTKETGIGAAIGAVAVGAIGAVTARKGERNEKFVQGAVIGGLGGAAVGSGSVVQICQALYDERRQLQQIVDAGEPRCLDGLKQREVNGVLTTEKSRDCAAVEGKDFDRIGQGRAVSTAVPTARAAPLPASKPQPARRPPVLVEIKPEK